jgi:hypothetical protein
MREGKVEREGEGTVYVLPQCAFIGYFAPGTLPSTSLHPPLSCFACFPHPGGPQWSWQVDAAQADDWRVDAHRGSGQPPRPPVHRAVPPGERIERGERGEGMEGLGGERSGKRGLCEGTTRREGREGRGVGRGSRVLGRREEGLGKGQGESTGSGGSMEGRGALLPRASLILPSPPYLSSPPLSSPRSTLQTRWIGTRRC